ncbi:MAG: DNA translocase FtsK 4TM domain-containing protein [Muribaculaceae bacterium]
MDSYNYTPNGIDYDPDLLYPESGDRRRYRERDQQPPQRRRRPERDPRRDDEEILQQARPRRRAAAQSDDDMEPRAAQQRQRGRQQRPQQRQRVEDAPAKERVTRAPKVRKPMKEWGIMKFFADKRTRAVLGVILICFAVYLVVAAISFFRSGADDQSVVTGKTVSQVVASGAGVSNKGGALGATLSQAIFTDGLGVGSLVGVIYLILLGLALMGIRKCNFWSMTFKALLVAITASLVLGLVGLASGSDLSLGGHHGQYMNELIISYADWIGAVLVSIVLVVAVIYVYLNDILKLINKYRAVRNARRARAEQAELEQAEERERVRKAMESSQLNDDDAEEAHDGEQVTPRRSDGFVDAADVDNEAEAAAPLMEFGEDHDPERHAEDEKSKESAPDEDAPADDSVGPEVNPDAQTPPEDMPLGGQVRIRRGGITASLGGFDDGDDDDDDPDAVKNEPAADAKTQNVVGSRNASSPIAAAVGQSMAVATAEAYVPETGTQAQRDMAYLDPNDPAAKQGFSEPGFEVKTQKIEESAQPQDNLYDPTAELSRYQAPSLDLLHDRPAKDNVVDIREQEENKTTITETLRSFDIEISDIQATVGPTVTLYEIKLAEGVRIAKVKRLEDDIAMSLAALGIRIIAPIPGKNTIGIEVPNKDPQTVSIRSILGSKAYRECKMKLPMAMGATISNEVYIADLTKMPHLLVAGATGMGKSVGLNTIIASLIYKKHPAELKFVLVDPKMVEFSLYSVLERHFLAKLPDDEDAVVTDMDKVVRTLNSLCVEMDNRYMLLRDANVRSITEYNERFVSKRLNPEKGHRYLPYIVMIVDEFADLIMTAGKQVETPIARIAQKARAVGMHLIVATQRPSTNVITGIIKANFPGRIAFRVTQMVDSRTILDCPGANQLIGRGDMLFSHNGKMERVQCAFIDTDEVEAICEHIDHQPGYEHAYYLPEPQLTDDEAVTVMSGERDPLFEECAAMIVQSGQASTSNLQRRYSIGYNRAGKIMDQLEQAGIVGPAQGSKPRQVLVDSIQLGRIMQTEE